MNQRETFGSAAKATALPLRTLLKMLVPAATGFLSVLVCHLYQDSLFSELANYPRTVLLFLWLFGTMMWCAFGVVRHGEAVAERLGEPYGTLVLTLSVIAIEVSLLASIMLHGENNPTLARDAMFATLMIVLNGMVGAALLMGALRYWEQEYNLAGARAFLMVIAALAVFALIIPNYTKTAPDPIEAPAKALLFAVITVLFYIVFLIIQTMRHRAFFAEPESDGAHELLGNEIEEHVRQPGSLGFHIGMLLLTLAPVLLLSEYLAIIVDFGLEGLGLPDALGGVMVALLVLSPEGLTAFHAALRNHLQRAVNVCLGSALATIGLTIPAVLIIGLITGCQVHLGLDEVQTVLLILTLFMSALTFGGVRTNVLQGTVHLLLFIVYVALIFSP
ncbi:calcium:proton antiporter [Methyloceanibacter sp.]|uniref:calcium:proton antiporter n=1 Tax=Methyloceanibacter sp. TaxID=1965321 RepID=UPI002D737C72|nr:calcium:proton antiporter [Methyloceanibacter sp.]HZP08847.1 calcium:proton antiporter [Methyloceanibacter sp.]